MTSIGSITPHLSHPNSTFVEFTPTPTDEEAAAIVAAIELAWPRAVVVMEDAVRPPAWRFSGRWWAKPVAARRDRPFY